jgi:hypothetical protein
MAKPTKRRIEGGGRVTPKGTRPEGTSPATSSSPSHHPPSPMWVPVLMFVLLGVGIAVIFLNYTEVLPGAANNLYLLAGLGSILAGIITATQYH